MTYGDRLTRARAAMDALGVDALLCSVGADLPYLTGYEAMPLERLTMLVVARADRATLVVPELEAPRVEPRGDAFEVRPWAEMEDPVAIVASLTGPARRVAVGDRTWARFLLALQGVMADATFVPASAVTSPLRAVKDADEVAALRAAARAVDAVALELRARPFAGRTEREVQRELVERMLDHGHERANFAIVGSGPNGASPHHDATDRVIGEGDVVVCDFGGARRGYCSDITRVFVVGEPAPEVCDAYAVLVEAQASAFDAARAATPCEDVDAAARRVIAGAGLGERFVHRTGHGIGLEEHEEPYLVAGNRQPLVAGNAFSIEPGIYVPGSFGLRLEDIVVVAGAGLPERLNQASRELATVG